MMPAGQRPVRAFAVAAGAAILVLASAARAQSPPADPPPGVLEPAAVPESSAVDAPATPPDGMEVPHADSAGTADSPGFNPRPSVVTRRVRLVGKPENVVRTGPGNGFAILGTWPPGTSFPVIARSGAWYGVRVSDTQTGWVHASLCRELDDLSGLRFRPNPRLYTRTGSYVLSAYGGAYAFDRKSNSAVLGGRVGYYVFDRIVAEAGVSWTHVHRPAEIVESLFGLRLEAEDFPMLFYQMNLTWELLPGRQMVPYVGGGAGSTLMQGRSTAAWNFGAGTRLFLSKRVAMRWDVRDYRFDNPGTSGGKTNNNVEFTLGSEVLY